MVSVVNVLYFPLSARQSSAPVDEKRKTRNKFLLHYEVNCDYTSGYCVNQYPFYTDWAFVASSVTLPSTGMETS